MNILGLIGTFILISTKTPKGTKFQFYRRLNTTNVFVSCRCNGCVLNSFYEFAVVASKAETLQMFPNENKLKCTSNKSLLHNRTSTSFFL